MNAQSIVGWLAILAALSIGIWQWALYGREQSFPVGRVVVGIFSATVIWYLVVWCLWVVVMGLVIFSDMPIMTEGQVRWSFDALMVPLRWFFGLFR